MTAAADDQDRNEQARSDRLRSIHAALAQALVGAPDATLELLPAAQLFVGKRLQAAPAQGKAPRQVPASDGYTIYVRLEAAGSGARPPQRTTQPADLALTDLHAAPLQLDRVAPEQDWRLKGSGDDVIVISARCGSPLVFDEVDSLLTALAGVLRSTDLPAGTAT